MTAPPGCVPMIDVSAAQGVVDWARVAAAGVRAAYVEHGVGNDAANPCAAAQVAGARAAGLLVGRYDFAYPIALAGAGRDPEGQAARHSALAQDEAWDLPAVLDVEWPEPAQWARWGCTWQQIPEWIASYIAARPEVTRLYTMPGFIEALRHPAGFATCDLWIAHWGVPAPEVPDPWTDWAAWQHSSTGTVDGVAGAVDLSWLRMP